MLVIHLAYVFVCLCLCRTHFEQKLTESTNENFQVCLRTSPILDLRTSNSGILYRSRRNVCQLVGKMGEKNKNNRCCKALWANTQT